MPTEYFIGLMSGTSMDGIDAVLVDFGADTPKLIHAINFPLPETLQLECRALCLPGDNEIDRMGQADRLLGDAFSKAVLQLLNAANISSTEINAIGSHGQTIRHRPDGDLPFTLQIGDANRIAELTGITTVADFRRRDMAAGGQGAPLVSAFHVALFQSSEQGRVILNIGGIANITILPTVSLQAKGDEPISGFDTGPGNGLMDAWVQKYQQQPFDRDGKWAASGRINETLLSQLLEDDYFCKEPPKSTGRELFNLSWLEQQLDKMEKDIPPADVMATLCEFTAISIADAIKRHISETVEIIVCGGGTQNGQLMQRLQAHLKPAEVKTTDDLGLSAEWVEAVAFAWLARETLAHRPGNVPGVTGAHHPVVLGGIYFA